MQYVAYKNKEVPNEGGEGSGFRVGLHYLSKPESDPSHTCRDWVVSAVRKHRLFLQDWQKSFTCGGLALTLQNSYKTVHVESEAGSNATENLP